MSHPFAALAQDLADASATVIRSYFRGDIQTQFKEANSPIVTLADQESERAMRDILAAQAPDHAIYGEEFGYPEGNPEHSWVLDPIDGTIAFSCGKPIFGTLIAYCHGDEAEVGIVNQPITNEQWLGIKGSGTTLNGKPVSPSKKTDLSQCNLATSSPYNFRPEQRVALEALKDKTHVLSCGGDCYNYGLVASGTIDILLECNLHLHDFAAAIPVIEAAGALITDLEGHRLTKASSGEMVLMSGNASLHEQALEVIRQSGYGR